MSEMMTVEEAEAAHRAALDAFDEAEARRDGAWQAAFAADDAVADAELVLDDARDALVTARRAEEEAS